MAAYLMLVNFTDGSEIERKRSRKWFTKLMNRRSRCSRLRLHKRRLHRHRRRLRRRRLRSRRRLSSRACRA